MQNRKRSKKGAWIGGAGGSFQQEIMNNDQSFVSSLKQDEMMNIVSDNILQEPARPFNLRKELNLDTSQGGISNNDPSNNQSFVFAGTGLKIESSFLMD